ncbi:MAG: F0F1 ATP synthase subunit A [Bacteroidota bacterium]
MSRNIYSTLLIFFAILLSVPAFSGDQHDHDGHDHSGHNHDHSGHDHDGHDSHGHVNACGEVVKHDFDPGKAAFHHISDQNIYSIGPLSIPLPCLMYVHGEGMDIFSSGRFNADGHGTGTKAYNGFVIHEGLVNRIADASFPKGEVELGKDNVYVLEKEINGKKKEVVYVCYNGKKWEAENRSTLDGGMFGGGMTSFTDWSPTKNVVSMILILLFGFFLFRKVANSYATREGMAPKGTQGFIEPIFLFIQEEVCKPFLGHKWEKFQPFIMSLFFFILFLNLFGQIPFFGGSNVTGALSVTMVLAVFTFIVVSFNGNKHYWEHIFWMPGVPAWVKTILTPVEFLGVFIKPLTLLLRLFGNITAGHMVIAIFVGLIFVFNNNGESIPATIGAGIGSTVLTMFMMAIELLVAFIQAFVFAILTASYIGAAIEEAHH